jgi:hypothetical protein
MSACEKCWEAARRDVMLVRGSVVDHYRRRLITDPHDSGEPASSVDETGLDLSVLGGTE